MSNATRRAGLILVAIGTTEGIPLIWAFAPVPLYRIGVLFDPRPAGWGANLLAALVTIGFVFHAARSFPMIGTRRLDFPLIKLIALPFALVTGTMEELWFRRQLMDGVAGAGPDPVLQVVASALAFGLVHAIWGGFARQWRVAATAMLSTSMLGGALAVVYLMGGRVVAPCIWAHVAINLAIEPWLILSAVSSAGRWQRSAAPAERWSGHPGG